MKKKLTALLLTTLVIVCCVVAIPLGAFAHTEPANGQIASFPQETLGASTQSSSYQLQYNTWDGVWDDNYLNYNCYSYALGKTDMARNPGNLTEQDCVDSSGRLKSINLIQQLVYDDLVHEGNNCIRSSKNSFSSPGAGVNLICVRNGHYIGSSVETDYHFMKYDNGNWYHKPGGTAILKYKYSPNYQVPWHQEYVLFGVSNHADFVYEGDIYFFYFQENHTNITYTFVNKGTHKACCRDCNHIQYEEHNMVVKGTRKVCSGCGYAINNNGSTIEPWNREDNL